MRSALFRGREHLEIGAVDTVAEGPAAIAISIGGRKKAYHHRDPNEDAALFAFGEAGILAAVADGHRGFEAAEVTLDHLAAHPAQHWTDQGAVDSTSWERHVLAVLCDATAQVLRELHNTEKQGARTTLALALVLPERDLVLHASIGDSHLFLAGPGGVEDLARYAPGDDGKQPFLGHGPETIESLAPKCCIGHRTLGDAIALLGVTDGLSEQGVGVADPEAAVAEVMAVAAEAPTELRARETARAIAETALAAQRGNPSGDNVAAAVVWLQGRL